MTQAEEIKTSLVVVFERNDKVTPKRRRGSCPPPFQRSPCGLGTRSRRIDWSRHRSTARWFVHAHGDQP